MLKRFNFKPGIYKEGTAYSNEGRFYDGSFVRFRSGKPEKMGGWQKSLPLVLLVYVEK